jgi:hypothetical protein
MHEQTVLPPGPRKLKINRNSGAATFGMSQIHLTLLPVLLRQEGMNFTLSYGDLIGKHFLSIILLTQYVGRIANIINLKHDGFQSHYTIQYIFLQLMTELTKIFCA